MSSVQQETILTGVRALMATLPGTDQLGVLKELVADYKDKLPDEALKALLLILPGPSATTTLESTRREYPDNRPDFAPHKAIVFSVTLDRPCRTSDLLVSLLGKANADILMSGWGDRVNFNIDAPRTNQAVLFVDSNEKARNRDYAERGAKTTQAEDFEAAGLTFGDGLQARIICAVLIKKARDVGLNLIKEASSWRVGQPEAVSNLDPNEFDLLYKLRDGSVRIPPGDLTISGNGRLRVYHFDDSSDARRWAFAEESTCAKVRPPHLVHTN